MEFWFLKINNLKYYKNKGILIEVVLRISSEIYFENIIG